METNTKESSHDLRANASMVEILDRIVLQELKRVQQEQKSEHGNSESL